MAARKSIRSRIRLVYRPGSPILKWIVLATVVLCTVALIVLGVAIRKGQERTQQQLQQLELLQQENRKLAQRIAELGSVQSVVRIAREKLGLEDPDAIIFDSVQTTDPQ